MPVDFTITRRVLFSETDMAGVMHFSNYLRWMEDAEHAFWRSIGRNVYEAHETPHLSWPRAKVGCEYHRPVRFDDEVHLSFRLTKIGEKSLQYEVGFRLSDREVARGSATIVCCMTEQGRFQSIAIPDAIREKLMSHLSMEPNK